MFSLDQYAGVLLRSATDAQSDLADAATVVTYCEYNLRVVGSHGAIDEKRTTINARSITEWGWKDNKGGARS